MIRKIKADDIARIMRCDGPIKRPKQYHTEPSSRELSEAQLEGRVAHKLAEMVVNSEISCLEDMIDRSIDGFIVTPAMTDYLTDYVETIRSYLSPSKSIIVDLPYQFDVQASPTDVFTIAGHIDCAVWNYEAATLDVFGLHYGWRVVDHVQNWQLLTHAIGLYYVNGWIPKSTRLHVIQPRAWHPEGTHRTWKTDRLTGESSHTVGLTQRLREIVSDERENLQTGPHCAKCDRAAECPTSRMAAAAAVEIASIGGTDQPTSNAELSYELELLQNAQDVLKNRLKALEELVEYKIRAGENVDGFELKQTLSRRSWIDNLDLEMVKTMTGIALSREQLLPPGMAVKAGMDRELMLAFTSQHPTGFKLIRSDIQAKAHKLLRNPQ